MIVVIAFLIAASAAVGGTVSHGPFQLTFKGGGEVNRLSISEADDGFTVRDRASRLRVKKDCVRLSRNKALCPPGRRAHEVRVKLGGGSDTFSASLDPGTARDRANGVTVSGGNGDDTMLARQATVADFYGQGGDDVLTGAFALSPDHLSLLHGGPGNDELIGGGSSTDLVGGDGNDMLRARGGDENDLSGGAGDDLFELGPAGGVVLAGAGADDVQTGKRGTAVIGGPGDDLIDAAVGSGRDLIDCGEGDDAVILGDEDEFGRRGDDRPNDPLLFGCESVTQV